MTWEETIQFIRTQPAFAELVEKAYFDENLSLNLERFKASEEYKETIRLMNHFAPGAKTLLDIGSGNGISAVAFAMDGYEVTASEPDKSETVGAGAIRKLKSKYALSNLEIFEDFAEDISFSPNSFDVVYVRQAMHHACELNKFIKNLAIVLKPGGLLLTIRDHVVYNEADKTLFLDEHPLQKFYGGENAFTALEYKNAFKHVGLIIKKELKFYDSVINYFPFTALQIEELKKEKENKLKAEFKNKLGILASVPGLFAMYKLKNKGALLPDEKNVAGRMYSYILTKP